MNKGTHRLPAAVLGFWLSAHALPSLGTADEPVHDKSLHIHGFANLTGVTTSGNGLFTDTADEISLDFHEIGLNAFWTVTPNLQLAGQILSRRLGEADDGEPKIDYALIDYNLVSRLNARAGVRIGRVKNPLGLYNDTRDVPMTRPSIFLPQSIYLDRTRKLALSADGLHVYGEMFGETSNISFQLGVGNPLKDPNIERIAFGREMPGKVTPQIAYIGQLRYQYDWHLDLAFSVGHVPIEYDPGLRFPADFTHGDLDLDYWIASAQYDWDEFSLTAEYARRDIQRQNLSLISDGTAHGESFYLQGTYRINSDWSAVLRYDVQYNDKEDRDGSRFTAATGLPAYSRFSKDWTLGLRWDPTDNLMFRAEYHSVNGTSWLLPATDDFYSNSKQHWNIFAISATVHF